MKKYISALMLFLIFSCSQNIESKEGEKSQNVAEVVELTDEQYPDNPDISIRHNLDGTFAHSEVEIMRDGDVFNLFFYPQNDFSDTLILTSIDLLEWMPTIPEHIKQDAYLSKVGVINQEWNRQQVKLFADKYSFKGVNKESQITKRVDLARNCLNSYLWEIITYADQDGELKPVYHGWFSFPKEMYQQLFFERNGIRFSEYAAFLEDWKDIESNTINLSVLGTPSDTLEVAFVSENNLFYPLVGERKKKQVNIVAPKNAKTINDFLNDSTLYATFTPPGYYNTKDPRKTQLSLLKELKSVAVSNWIAKNKSKDSTLQLRLVFDNGLGKQTDLVIGGIITSKIPVLAVELAHKGFQMPMGIANHSFYETYEENQSRSAKDQPFYAFLLDKDGKWLDSHKVGIDGPLFHYDEQGKLHLWILSFERHSFVGHYILEL